jgi:hypothetical protein
MTLDTLPVRFVNARHMPGHRRMVTIPYMNRRPSLSVASDASASAQPSCMVEARAGGGQLL